MSTARTMGESFQETFCAQYGVPAEHYDATVLRLTLYPHARWLAALGSLSCLAPDRDFVDRVGRLTHWRGFVGEAHEFQHQAENRRFSRRRLRMRVSVGRMRVLFSEVMGGTIEAGRSRHETHHGPGSVAFE